MNFEIIAEWKHFYSWVISNHPEIFDEYKKINSEQDELLKKVFGK